MVDLLYRMIYWVAEVHDHILNINNAGGWYFDDKQLHFIVIGVVGMLMIFVTYPVFKLLAETGHTMVISWLYTFTLVLVITFAIEIGQWFSGTGRPDADDMASGVAGFLIFFLVFAVIRGFFQLIARAFRGPDDRERARRAELEALKKKNEIARQQKSFTGYFREKKASAKNLAREGLDVIGELAAKEEKTAEVPDLREKARSAMASASQAKAATIAYSGDSKGLFAADNDQILKPGEDSWTTGGSTDPAGGSESDFDIIDELESQTEDSLMNDARATLVLDSLASEVMIPQVPEAPVTLTGDAPETDERMTYVMPSPDETTISEQNQIMQDKRSDTAERKVYKG